MTPEEFLKFVESHADDIARLVNRTLPVKVGNEAKAHFQDNFRKEGFVNGGLHKWQPAQRKLVTARYRKGKNGKRVKVAARAANRYNTLMSSRNHLYSSTEYEAKPGEAIIKNEVEYAAVHNEGLMAGRKGHQFRMPKRQFIGESKELNDKVENIITTEITKLFK